MASIREREREKKSEGKISVSKRLRCGERRKKTAKIDKDREDV